MKWQRERFGPRLRAPAWMKISRRQRILAVLGVVSVLAMAGVAASRLLGTRRLPPAVQGLWRTDTPAYAGRLFELRARRIGFVIGDSLKSVVVHFISRVRQEPHTQGTLYRVEYVERGQRGEFDFVYDAGPPETIRLAHQVSLLWRRDPSNRSLLPEF